MVLPIQLSYFNAEALATLIGAHYALPSVRCRLLTNSLRDVYLVESTGARYVFYAYRYGWRTSAQIQAEWDLMASIGTEDAVLRVPQPVPTQNGVWLVTLSAPEGERYGVLATYIEGESLRVRISAPIVAQYGQALGRLHAVWSIPNLPLLAESSAVRPSHDGMALLNNAYRHLEMVLDTHPALWHEIRAGFDVVLPRVAALIPTPATYGLVHGDIARHNALIAPDDTLTLLDFDYCGVGWRTYDVATMFFSLHAQPQREEYNAAFVEGYRQQYSLPAEEAALLPLFEAVRVLFDAGLMAEMAPVWGYQHCWKEVQWSLGQLERVLPLV